MIAAAGLLAGAGPSKDAKDEGTSGTVVKVDVSRNSIAIKTMSGRQTFRVTGDTKYFGPDGEACANGIQDERLATGNEVRIVTGLGGKTAKEVHLSSGKTAGKGKDRAR